MIMSTVAVLHDVTMCFHGHTALEGVSVGFQDGAITGLLGSWPPT